jgi:ABC-type uncharacterized transport system fused permease/ATPase subunit
MPSARKPALRGRRLARALWRLVVSYWTSPDAKWGALLLGGAVALELGSVQASVLVSDAQRRSVEALEARDAPAFLLTVGLFVGLSLFSVLVSAFRIYVRQVLEIRWRRGLTGDYVGRWVGGQAGPTGCSSPAHRRRAGADTRPPGARPAPGWCGRAPPRRSPG